jgi:DNA repair protein RAD16
MGEEDPAAKAIVFSQFVAMLDLIEHRLQKAGIRTVKLNGGMSVAQREAVLTSFKEEPGVRVILISLKVSSSSSRSRSRGS